MNLSYQSLYANELLSYFDELASLRMQVFRDFPYLYDGNQEYEKKYLKAYAECSDFFAVLAFADKKVVGMSTALPLAFAEEVVREPFERLKLPLAEYFYFGESVLLKEFRGRGAAHQFFAAREKAGVKMGFSKFCFCAVERESAHPMRPSDYQDLTKLWHQKGFFLEERLQTSFSWQDLGEQCETKKPMKFWIKELS